LHEANELSNVANDIRRPPMVEKVVFALSGAIAISANVDTNELNTFWEDE
jgi:hypothetical protein